MTKLLFHDGIERPLLEWAERRGLKPHTIHSRLFRGWSVAAALDTPAATPNLPASLLLTAHGRTQSLAAWSAEIGLDAETIRNRLNRGWSIERALTTRRLRMEWTAEPIDPLTGGRVETSPISPGPAAIPSRKSETN